MGKKDDMFDMVMQSVGNNGPFQRRFNYLYNLVFALVASMPVMNIILALAVPDHWCHVPGREATNYTLEEWKNLTLPKEINNKGILAPSSCEMYNLSEYANIQPGYNYSTMKCQYGYDYDKTWYSLTVPSQEDWVCDKGLRVTNIFVITRIGDMLGALIFGQMGDYIGRKPVFFLSLVLLLIGKVMHLFLTKWYYWYMAGTLIGTLTPMAVYQAVLVIGMEISTPEDNSHIAMLQGIGWTLGISILPLLYWWIQDWFYFVLVSSIPVALFLINNKYMTESPRWLANRGKIKECEEVLRQIAKINKTTLNDDALEILKEDRTEIEKLYGMASLFSNFRLAKYTIMMSICWIVEGFAHFLLILNVTNMDGNPFLNFLYQGLVELPALFVGRWATNTLGRKWTAVASFAFAILFTLPLLFTSIDPSLHGYSTALTVLIKFCKGISYYTMMIQGVEIYPTCLRQSGIALGVTAGNAVGILGPYAVYLGTAYDVRYPYIILILMMLLGFGAELMLPETLHRKLPETVAEAQEFGRDQKIWELPKKPVKKFDESLEKNKNTEV